jgi:hypothetical protein
LHVDFISSLEDIGMKLFYLMNSDIENIPDRTRRINLIETSTRLSNYLSIYNNEVELNPEKGYKKLDFPIEEIKSTCKSIEESSNSEIKQFRSEINYLIDLVKDARPKCQI